MDKIRLSTGTVVETTDVELPDGMVAKEFALPSGGARVRVLPVPPFLVIDALNGRADLAKPDVPLVKIEGIGEKWVPARQGEAPYEEWKKQCGEIDQARDDAYDEYTWDYGVAQWQRDGEWVDDVPKAWKFPKRWERLGRKPRSGTVGRRVDYIRYALVNTNENVEVCQLAMGGHTSPIRPSEAGLIAELFRGEEERISDTDSAAE